MSKRITSAIVLVTLLAIAPVAVAAPADRGVDEGGHVVRVQAVWEGLAHFLGIALEPFEPKRADEPRSRASADSVGPHIDP